MEKRLKNFRTLDMYVRLCEGKTVNKSEEARRFDVDERSIQRDIDDIRAFLDDRQAAESSFEILWRKSRTDSGSFADGKGY